jgi:hypothetical protein
MAVKVGKIWINTGLLLLLCIPMGYLMSGCGGAQKEQADFSFEFEQAVDLNASGYELSTPVLYPDQEYGGVFIGAGNSNAILQYDPVEGLKTYIQPAEIPAGAEGIGAFCYANGDIFFHPGEKTIAAEGGVPDIYQLTRNGRIRKYVLSDTGFEDVRNLGAMVYVDPGRLLVETSPRGPFATLDLISGTTLRYPTEPPPGGTIQKAVPDFGAGEVYVERRAKDLSIYFLRYTFKGTYRGPAYVHRRALFVAAATHRKVHLIQYVSGAVDVYDFRFTQLSTFDLAKVTTGKYDAYFGLTVVWGTAYVIGQKGPIDNPTGYDLLVYKVKTGS